MSDTYSDSQSPRYLSSFFSTASSLYQKAKSINPMMGSKIETIEVWIQPLAKPIITYSEPYITTLDTQLSSLMSKTTEYIHTLSDSMPLSLAEKKRFYMTCIQAWLSNDLSYENLTRSLQTVFGEQLSQEMVRSAEEFFTSAKEFAGDLTNIPEFTAHILAKGDTRIKRELSNAWYDKKVSNQRQFVQSLRSNLTDVWDDKMMETAQLYYAVCLLQRDIKYGIAVINERELSVVESAIEIADKTSYLILAGLDEIYNWAVDSLDSKVVSKWVPVPSSELQLRGNDRLLAMNHRVASELSLSLKSALEKLPTYYEIQEYSLKDYKDLVLDKLSNLQHIKLDDIKESDIPEQTIQRLDSMLEKVGLNKLVVTLHSRVWFKIDKNHDGKISVGDLYESVMVLINLNPLKYLLEMLVKSDGQKQER
jgi:hypothetical protein